MASHNIKSASYLHEFVVEIQATLHINEKLNAAGK